MTVLAGSVGSSSGFARFLLATAAIYAGAGALAGRLFSFLWRRLVSTARPDLAQALAFTVASLSWPVLFHGNRLLSAPALHWRSLLLDAAVLAVTWLPCALIVARARRGAAAPSGAGSIPWPRRAALAACAVLLLLLGARAFLEEREASPLGQVHPLAVEDRWGAPYLPDAGSATTNASGTEAAAAVLPVSKPRPRHPQLMMIGLDGATWDVLLPLIRRGQAPHIEALLARGVGGVLTSEEDAFSPIVWTTIMTGKAPRDHGIDSLLHQRSTNRRVPALWSILAKDDQRLLVANVPGTFPAEKIRGAYLSGFPNDTETGNNLGYLFTTRPLDQWDRLAGLTRLALTPERSVVPGGSGGSGGRYRITLRERTGLEEKTPLGYFHLTRRGPLSALLGPSTMRTYASLDMTRTADGLVFDVPDCETCRFTLAAGWSPWLRIERAGAPLVFRIRLLESTPGALSLYVTPLFKQDLDQSVQPAALRSMVESRYAPFVVEGAGWVQFQDPRLLDVVQEQMFGIAQNKFRIISDLWHEQDWDGLIYVMTLTDRIQHPFWSFMDPAIHPRVEPDLASYEAPLAHGTAARYASAVDQAYMWADAAIGQLLEKGGPETLVVIASDHGFQSGRSAIGGAGVHSPDGIYIFSGPGLGDGLSHPPGYARLEGERLVLDDLLPSVLASLRMPIAKDFPGHPADFVRRWVASSGGRTSTIPSYDGLAVSSGSSARETSRETLEQLRSLGYVN